MLSAPIEYDDDVVNLISSRCTEVESGARVVDAILTNTVLPAISQEMLGRLMEGKSIDRVQVSVEEGDLRYVFE